MASTGDQDRAQAKRLLSLKSADKDDSATRAMAFALLAIHDELREIAKTLGEINARDVRRSG